MALTACHECGHQVSTEADACPQCGARVRPPQSAPGVGTVAAGTFGGLAGCAAAPFVIGCGCLVLLFFMAALASAATAAVVMW